MLVGLVDTKQKGKFRKTSFSILVKVATANYSFIISREKVQGLQIVSRGRGIFNLVVGI